MEFNWLPTALLDTGEVELQNYYGFWCAPGSPYKSMNGAINGIKYARENNRPFIGTCGGFQHAVIEFGRNVLHISELEDRNFNPYNSNKYIAALSCSLIDQTRCINVAKNSRIFTIYGDTEIKESYNCSFGLNKDFQSLLNENNFKVVGIDELKEARIMTIESKTFYVITLFQPQLSSTYEYPHPLILEYINSIINI